MNRFIEIETRDGNASIDPLKVSAIIDRGDYCRIIVSGNILSIMKNKAWVMEKLFPKSKTKVKIPKIRTKR